MRLGCGESRTKGRVNELDREVLMAGLLMGKGGRRRLLVGE